MRHMTPAGRLYLRGFENCRLTAYRDTNGTWTIGYGHTGHDVGAGTRWTQAEAEAAYERDLLEVEFEVSRMLRLPVEDYEFDALCCLAYNIGWPRLASSTLMSKLNKDDRPGAAAQFLRWNKETVDGVLRVNAGLTQRRAAERAMFEGKSPRLVGD